MAGDMDDKSPYIQPHLRLPDVRSEDALSFLGLEMQRHRESGRKKFLVRVPVERVKSVFALMLRASKTSMISLEDQLKNIPGLENGRTVRRYVSGESHMAWPTYRRILIWVLAEGWVKDYAFVSLIMDSFTGEAAQVVAQGLLAKTRRRTKKIVLTEEDLISAFNAAYRANELERHTHVVRRAELNSHFKELAIEFDFQFN